MCQSAAHFEFTKDRKDRAALILIPPDFLFFLFHIVFVGSDAVGAWSLRELAVAANVQSGAKPPGSWAYSNTNYLLLGKIIDVASGSTWPQEVRRRILDPMGLSATFVYGFEPVVGDFVKGYEDDGAGWSDMTGRTHPTVMNAAGCMISSMRDLGRFWRALNEGQILSPTMLDANAERARGAGATMGARCRVAGRRLVGNALWSRWRLRRLFDADAILRWAGRHSDRRRERFHCEWRPAGARRPTDPSAQRD